MKQYELMVIVDPEIGTDAITKKLDEVKKLLATHSGEVFFEDLWGVRDLAYKINKRDKGFYAVFDLNLDSAGIKDINTTLKIDNDILRHLLMTLPAGYEPKSYKDADKEAEAARKEKKIDEVVDAKPKKVTKAAPKKDEVKEEVTEKKEVVAEEPAVKEEPTAEEKAEEKDEEKKEKDKATLEDVDKKLSNLLDNPDLNF